MKKLFFLFAAMFIAATASAQIPKFLKNFAIQIYGTVTFRDGHEETYDFVTMPSQWAKSIDVKNVDTKKETIDAKNIRCVTYWSEKLPEEKHTIYCLLIEDSRKKGRMLCEWGIPVMGNEWGVVFRSYSSYSFDYKSGEFSMWVEADPSLTALGKPELQVWQPLLLQRADMDHAVFVGNVRSYKDRKTKEKVSEYCWPSDRAKDGAENFKDNPEIYQQILDGTLKASDLQFILDQM